MTYRHVPCVAERWNSHCENFACCAYGRSRHFETRLVPMPASKADLAAEYLLYRRYQVLHHKDSPDEVSCALSSHLVESPQRNSAQV